MAATVPAHNLKLALVCPQIAPNTGNIARLCVATATELHLVRPLGFNLTDRQVRRSAMDYWPRLRLTVHDDADAFLNALAATPLWLFTSRGQRSFWEVPFHDGDCLVFGNETHGLPDSITSAFPDRCLRIPQSAGERCLNLSTAAGIALYESLRQLGQRAGGPP